MSVIKYENMRQTMSSNDVVLLFVRTANFTLLWRLIQEVYLIVVVPGNSTVWNSMFSTTECRDHWRIQGALPVRTPPLTGPNSFIFAYVFAKKRPHRRSAPTPHGKSWIRHWRRHMNVDECQTISGDVSFFALRTPVWMKQIGLVWVWFHAQFIPTHNSRYSTHLRILCYLHNKHELYKVSAHDQLIQAYWRKFEHSRFCILIFFQEN